MSLFVSPFVPALTFVGTIAPAARLFFYATGTSILKAVYADSDLATPLANPVIADAFGRFPPIYLDDGVAYRAVLTTAVGVVLGDVDPLSASAPAGFTRQAGNYTALIASDPLGGIYRPVPGVPTSVAAYVRDWDGIHGQPEWFYNGGGDWLPALNACVALCPIVQLGKRDYPISNTWVIDREQVVVQGVSRFNKTSGSGPRVLLTGAQVSSADVMRVGYLVQPSGAPEQSAAQAGFLKGVYLRDFAIWRDGAPNPCANGAQRGVCPAGLRVKYVLKCDFQRLLVQDSTCGVYVGGAIYSKFDDVEARIDRPTTAGNYDTCTGWYGDGEIAFGYAGGNASIYVNRAVGVAGRRNGSTNPTTGMPIGFLFKGAFVDTFLDWPEVAQTSTGIVFDATGYNTFARNGDLHIRNPIIDQVDYVGIEFANMDKTCGVELIAPYIAPTAGGQVGLLVHDGGSVTVMGGQIIAGWTVAPFLYANLFGGDMQGLKVICGTSPTPAKVQNCAGARFLPEFKSTAAFSSSMIALDVTGTTHDCYFAPIVAAGGGTNSGGISFANTCTYNTVDATAIDPDALADGGGITGDRARKVFYNAATAPVGSFGTGNVRLA